MIKETESILLQSLLPITAICNVDGDVYFVFCAVGIILSFWFLLCCCGYYDILPLPLSHSPTLFLSFSLSLSISVSLSNPSADPVPPSILLSFACISCTILAISHRCFASRQSSFASPVLSSASRITCSCSAQRLRRSIIRCSS